MPPVRFTFWFYFFCVLSLFLANEWDWKPECGEVGNVCNHKSINSSLISSITVNGNSSILDKFPLETAAHHVFCISLDKLPHVLCSSLCVVAKTLVFVRNHRFSLCLFVSCCLSGFRLQKYSPQRVLGLASRLLVRREESGGFRSDAEPH